MSRPPPSKRPRREKNPAKKKIHAIDSEMHQAIVKMSYRQVTKLLDDGHRLCTGVGLNCFTLAATFSRPMNQQGCWNLLLKMLKLDPAGIAAKNSSGTTLLMEYCDSAEKIKTLVDLGADVNAKDKLGNSVLTRAFLHKNVNLKAFKQLLDLDADIGGFDLMRWPNIKSINSLVVYFQKPKTSNEKFKILTHLKEHKLLKKDFWFDKDEKHLLFYLVEAINKFYFIGGSMEDNALHSLFDFLQLNLFENDRPTYLVYVGGGSPSDNYWSRLRKILKIHDFVKMDPLGFLVYCARVSCFDEFDRDMIGIFLAHLPYQPKAVHPIHALLYKLNKYMAKNLDNERTHQVRRFFPLIAKVIRDIQLELGDHPLPHSRVKFVHSLSTDVLVMMTPLMASLDALMTLLPFFQLSPHPPYLQLVNFALYTNSIARGMLLETYFAQTFGLLLTEKRQMLIEAVGYYAACFFPNSPAWRHLVLESGKYRLPKVTKSCAKFILSGGVHSLLEMCAWNLRNQLFARRTKNSDSLPILIKRLCSSGFLPKSLEPELLIYKNTAISIQRKS